MKKYEHITEEKCDLRREKHKEQRGFDGENSRKSCEMWKKETQRKTQHIQNKGYKMSKLERKTQINEHEFDKMHIKTGNNLSKMKRNRLLTKF